MKWFLGLFWLIVLFAACFSAVHILLYFLQFEKSKSRADSAPKTSATADEPSKQKKEQTTLPEPIYFIVEKKSRKKNTYSKPKQIKFE